MDIVAAMFFTILKVLGLIVECLIYLGMVGAVMFVVGISVILYNRYINRTDDEPETDEDDFEESYAREPGKRLITSRESDRMWREMDRLNDQAILENTKDL